MIGTFYSSSKWERYRHDFGGYFVPNRDKRGRRKLFLETVSGQIRFNSNKLLQNSVAISANRVFSICETKISEKGILHK